MDPHDWSTKFMDSRTEEQLDDGDIEPVFSEHGNSKGPENMPLIYCPIEKFDSVNYCIL